MKQPKIMYRCINWGAVSMALTGNRFQIRSNYCGKKYKEPVDAIRTHNEKVNEIIDKFKNEK